MSEQAWIAVVVVLGIIAVFSLIGAIRLLIRVVRTRRMLGDLGAGGKIAFYGAIIYTILPVDLIPDPIYLDDMGVLSGALFYLGRLAIKRRAERANGAPAPAGKRVARG